MAYKNFYSTFDKIAMFLSNYIDIRLKSYEIDFAKIWNCKNGDIRSEILAYSQNMPLLGLYNIKLDVYGMKTDWYVVDEQTKDLKMLRNYMEHKSIIIKDEPMSRTEYQLTISKKNWNSILLGWRNLLDVLLSTCATLFCMQNMTNNTHKRYRHDKYRTPLDGSYFYGGW